MANWFTSFVVPEEFFRQRSELHFLPHLAIFICCLAIPPLMLFAWLTVALRLSFLSFLTLTATPIIVLFSLIIGSAMVIVIHSLLKAMGGTSTLGDTFGVLTHAYIAVAAGVVVVAALAMVQQPFVPALASAGILVFLLDLLLMLLFIGDFFFVAVEGLAVRHNVTQTRALIALLLGILAPLLAIAVLKLMGVNFAL